MALTEEGLLNVTGIASRWVRLGNGAKAHYMTAGEVGPNVILLHGGFPRFQWDSFVAVHASGPR